MRLILRAAVALFVAWFLSSVLPLESGLTFPTHPLHIESLLSRPTPTPQAAVHSWSVSHPIPYAVQRPAARPAPAPVVLSAENTVLAYAPPPVRARAAILVDLETGRTLFRRHDQWRLPMASTTKITTAILALQYSRLSDLVRVSAKAAAIGESTMGLHRGEQVTVRQLLYGLMLNSGNDAAIALAEHVAGTEARFVGMMNALARKLHMWHTHYATPHGLDAP